jgi:hypothetical protein
LSRAVQVDRTVGELDGISAALPGLAALSAALARHFRPGRRIAGCACVAAPAARIDPARLREQLDRFDECVEGRACPIWCIRANLVQIVRESRSLSSVVRRAGREQCGHENGGEHARVISAEQRVGKLDRGGRRAALTTPLDVVRVAESSADGSQTEIEYRHRAGPLESLPSRCAKGALPHGARSAANQEYRR